MIEAPVMNATISSTGEWRRDAAKSDPAMCLRVVSTFMPCRCSYPTPGRYRHSKHPLHLTLEFPHAPIVLGL